MLGCFVTSSSSAGSAPFARIWFLQPLPILLFYTMKNLPPYLHSEKSCSGKILFISSSKTFFKALKKRIFLALSEAETFACSEKTFSWFVKKTVFILKVFIPCKSTSHSTNGGQVIR
jgi:hypothetical protein